MARSIGAIVIGFFFIGVLSTRILQSMCDIGTQNTV